MQQLTDIVHATLQQQDGVTPAPTVQPPSTPLTSSPGPSASHASCHPRSSVSWNIFGVRNKVRTGIALRVPFFGETSSPMILRHGKHHNASIRGCQNFENTVVKPLPS